MVPVLTRQVSEQDINENIPLGEYLFLRIAQANPNLKSVFGIPGDFNLNLLEHLYCDSVANEKQIRMVNLCNELNGAYAADGYAQAIGGLSVFITTFGVGELSAINGIAGSFAEYAPVLHIVGTTSTVQMNYAEGTSSVKNLHHLLQSKKPLQAPNHHVYKKLVDDVSVAQESLYSEDDMSNTLNKIDRVLVKILQESRPGYLFIPSDVPDIMVPKSRLYKPLSCSELVDRQLLDLTADDILQKLYAAKRPSIMGDALVQRFNQRSIFSEFVAKLPQNFVKLFNSNMGRVIDEQLPNFVGTYYGKLSPSKGVKNSLEKDTDLLIDFGFFNGETNTAGYSWDLKDIENYIEIHPDYVLIDGEYRFHKNYVTDTRSFSMGDLIAKLAEKLDVNKMVHRENSNVSYKFEPTTLAAPASNITQAKLVDFFNNYLQPNDILIVETCTFLFSMPDLKLPSGVTFISQSFWGSIGYALPSTFGASIAEKDLNGDRRIILVQGDGSAQMTVQELSSFLRYDIKAPEIFLLNNSGYTVERIIKGPTRSYNDIQDTWKWTQLFKIFGDEKEEKHESIKLTTSKQMDAYFKQNTSSDKIKFYELILDKLDHPERFAYVAGQKPVSQL